MEVIEKTEHLEKRKSGRCTYNVASNCPFCGDSIGKNEKLPDHLNRCEGL